MEFVRDDFVHRSEASNSFQVELKLHEAKASARDLRFKPPTLLCYKKILIQHFSHSRYDEIENVGRRLVNLKKTNKITKTLKQQQSALN